MPAQGVTQLWTQHSNGPLPGKGFPTAMTSNSQGTKLFVTGRIYMGRGTGSFDYGTAAIDATSGQVLWSANLDGDGHSEDMATAIATDDANVYVTGQGPAAGGAGTAIYTAAYSVGGTFQWRQTYANASAVSIAVKNGVVYVVGTTTGAPTHFLVATFDAATGNPGWTVNSTTGTDVAVAGALSPSGTLIYVTGRSGTGSATEFLTEAWKTSDQTVAWTKPANAGYGPDAATALAVTNGLVYVTGTSTNINGDVDYLTHAYAANGSPEASPWPVRWPSQAGSTDIPTAITADGTNVFVTGSSAVSGQPTDYATIAMSASSGFLWADTRGSTGADTASALARSGTYLYVTGTSSTSTNGDDYYTLRYSLSGVMQLQVYYSSVDPTSGSFNADHAVAMVANGAVYVAGGTNSSRGYTTLRYDASLNAAWSTPDFYDGPQANWDQASGIATNSVADPTTVFVTGAMDGRTDYGTVSYQVSDGTQLKKAVCDGSIRNLDNANAIATLTDPTTHQGRVFVTGRTDDGASSIPNAPPYNWDYGTVAYDPNLTVLWNQNVPNVPTSSLPDCGVCFDEATAITAAGTHVFVTGTIGDAEATCSTNVYGTIGYDAATGTKLWDSPSLYPSSNYPATVAGTVATSDGSAVFVTGKANLGSCTTPNNDYATEEYNSTGADIWDLTYDSGNGNDAATALTLSPNGSRLYVTGTIALPGQGNHVEWFTMAYRVSDHQRLWMTPYPSNDGAPVAIAASTDGHVYVTGTSEGPCSSSPTTAIDTVEYDSTTGNQVGERCIKGDGTGNDVPAAIAVSPDQTKVVVAGTASSHCLGAPASLNYETLIFDASLDPPNEQCWDDTYHLDDTVSALAVSRASSGATLIFVTGMVYEGADSAGNPNYDYQTVAYSATN